MLLLRLIVNVFAVMITARLLPGVHIDDWLSALIVVVVLAVANAVVKPLLVILTLPVTVLTLGLFLLVVNALVIMLVDWLVPGFRVGGFWWAMLFSLVLSVINSVLSAVLGGTQGNIHR